MISEGREMMRSSKWFVILAIAAALGAVALVPAVVRGMAVGSRPSIPLSRPTQLAGRPRAQQPGQVQGNAEAPRGPNLPPATIAGEVAASAVTEPEKQSDWPAVAMGADGATWVAYVEWNG